MRKGITLTAHRMCPVCQQFKKQINQVHNCCPECVADKRAPSPEEIKKMCLLIRSERPKPPKDNQEHDAKSLYSPKVYKTPR